MAFHGDAGECLARAHESITQSRGGGRGSGFPNPPPPTPLLAGVLALEPYTADYGVGMQGGNQQWGAYVAQDPDLGLLCFSCDAQPGVGGALTVTPRDAYHSSIFLAPWAAWLRLDNAQYTSASLIASGSRAGLNITLTAPAALCPSPIRLRINYTVPDAPGSIQFVSPLPAPLFTRGAFELPCAAGGAPYTVVMTWAPASATSGV